MAKLKITLTTCAAMAPGQEDTDTVVTGFRARRQKGEDVYFRVFYTTKDGRKRPCAIGRLGSPWTPDTARAEARRLLYAVAAGRDPASERAEARTAPTVAELCDLYLRDAEAGRLSTRRGKTKSASTLLTDRGRIERHIKPLLGELRVAAVSSDDAEGFMHDVAEHKTAAKIKTRKHGLANVRGGRGTAARTTGLLGAIFAYAVRKKMRPDNPVRGVIRPADGRRERRLSDDEFGALGAALRKAERETMWPPAVAATRFLALSGWRLGEALTLKWSDVDLARRTALLVETKTGRSVRPLSRAACDVLAGAPRMGAALVFPASRGDGPMGGYRSFWLRIAALGALPADVTPHTLRHSFASLAADLGYSELAIAALLGHVKGSITSRYTHQADAVLLQAADAVASKVAKLMGDRDEEPSIIPFPGRREGGAASA